MTQPPVSMAVRGLEEDLGVRLLQRSTRRVELTSAGRLLLERGRALERELGRLEEDIKRAAAGAVGRLSVGFVGIAMWMGVADIIRRFGQSYPEVSLTLEEVPSGELQLRLERGDLDVGFIRALDQPPKTLDRRLVSEEHYWLAIPEGHPLEERKQVDVAALHGQAMLFFPRRFDPKIYDRWQEVFAAHDVSPELVQEARSIQTEIGLVSAGVGVCLVTASVARQPYQGVVFRRLTGVIPTVRLYAAWRAGDRHAVRNRFLAELMNTP